MDPGELSIFTTQELIDELLRRSTFLGVVVHAEQEQRHAGWRGDKVFKVRFNDNLEAGQVGRLLEVVANHIERDVD